MSIHEEDFVIINKEDVSDDTISRDFDKEINHNCSESLSNSFMCNDEAIARELQNQIDREYNENLNRFERRSGTSKLIISYEKYRKCNYDGYCEEDYNEFDPPDDVDWDRFEAIDKTFNSVPPCGYLFNKDGTIVTKHDVSLNGQRNMKKLMSLPPNVQTGDGAAIHMEISNSVLNELKLHSQVGLHRENIRRKDKKYRKERKLDKVRKTCLMGVDQRTNDTIHGLLKGMNPCLEGINGRVGEGKESLIYYGQKPEKEFYYFNKPINYDCILKLYKIDGHDFRQQQNYMADDYRYAKRCNSKMNRYNVICLWAEKERDNLELLKRHILCPEPIMLKNNVLVMSFIGYKGRPAKKLSQVDLSTREYFSAYVQITENMKIMYTKARLVHADLSEYNILWHKQKCYFIDVSQAIDIAHIRAFGYLKRDCKNIIDFFDRKHIPGTMTKEELFKYITGQDFYDEIGLELLTLNFKEKRRPKSHSDHKFEEFWARSKVKLVGV